MISYDEASKPFDRSNSAEAVCGFILRYVVKVWSLQAHLQAAMAENGSRDSVRFRVLAAACRTVGLSRRRICGQLLRHSLNLES